MNIMPESRPVEHVSSLAFAPTLERLVRAIETAGMTVFARIDHASGAREVGMEMPPTVVLLYGHPRGGTPIILAARGDRRACVGLVPPGCADAKTGWRARYACHTPGAGTAPLDRGDPDRGCPAMMKRSNSWSKCKKIQR